jgi:hypothetical protein
VAEPIRPHLLHKRSLDTNSQISPRCGLGILVYNNVSLNATEIDFLERLRRRFQRSLLRLYAHQSGSLAWFKSRLQSRQYWPHVGPPLAGGPNRRARPDRIRGAPTRLRRKATPRHASGGPTTVTPKGRFLNHARNATTVAPLGASYTLSPHFVAHP